MSIDNKKIKVRIDHIILDDYDLVSVEDLIKKLQQFPELKSSPVRLEYVDNNNDIDIYLKISEYREETDEEVKIRLEQGELNKKQKLKKLEEEIKILKGE